jgi:starch synthase (maltosyl-transferring)
MPNVILEAMASGKPVVCSRVQGSEELLAHQPEKQSFVVGDGLAMVRTIDALLNDPSLCQQIGQKNQQHVGESFSIDAMVDAYRRHYRRLTGDR